MTFKCGHNKVIYSLEQGGGEESEEMAVPWPKQPQLVNKGAEMVGKGARYLGGPVRLSLSSVCSSGSDITAESLQARGRQLVFQLEQLE